MSGFFCFLFLFFTSVLRCYVAVVMVIVTVHGMLKESEARVNALIIFRIMDYYIYTPGTEV